MKESEIKRLFNSFGKQSIEMNEMIEMFRKCGFIINRRELLELFEYVEQENTKEMKIE